MTFYESCKICFQKYQHDTNSSIVDATEQDTKHSASKMTSSNQGRKQLGHFLGTKPGIDFLKFKMVYENVKTIRENTSAGTEFRILEHIFTKVLIGT